jgi:release factor glutamine methyltransferase
LSAAVKAAEEVWTTRRVLAWTTPHFEIKGIDSPRLTAEVLLAHVLKVDRVRLYVDLERPLEKSELATFKALIGRRVAGEPTQYLTGFRDFYNRRFAVDARVLIPRPETELLVEAVLSRLPADAVGPVLDLCTGSGCIAISLAAERSGLKVDAVDLSPGACEVARANAESLKVSERVNVLEGDLFAPLPPATYTAIVSNPPYVQTGEIDGLSREVQSEPRSALDGGADGLDFVRRIATEARARLQPGGLLALEIGDNQGDPVRAILEQAGYESVRIEKDLARLDRLALANSPAAEGPQV